MICTISHRQLLLLSACAVLIRNDLFGAMYDGLELVEVESGTVSFEAPTSMPAVTVKGKSNGLRGQVRVTKSADGLALESVEAHVSVKSLLTGMSVRDEHMRRYIFTSPDGKTPDLSFIAEKGACSKVSDKLDYTCQIGGNLSIRGTSRPLAMTLKVKRPHEVSDEFRATGSAIVKLSDYNINPPVQFGVKVLNEVRFDLELVGKGKAPLLSDEGRTQ